MDDRTLWDAFSAARLPKGRWTHREHLRVAWMYLERHALDEAHASALGRDAVLAHYSRERIMSVRARSIYVEPDLAPLY